MGGDSDQGTQRLGMGESAVGIVIPEGQGAVSDSAGGSVGR